jgi:hypothetical protein
MPDLAAIQNGYAALGVQVIGASTDEVAIADLKKQINAMLAIAEGTIEKTEPVARKDAKETEAKVSSVPS